ncbi:MAG: hypothetical protein AVDCRST_MAG78-2605, partial [uncultured Rubrobacteraceae bacterium]
EHLLRRAGHPALRGYSTPARTRSLRRTRRRGPRRLPVVERGGRLRIFRRGAPRGRGSRLRVLLEVRTAARNRRLRRRRPSGPRQSLRRLRYRPVRRRPGRPGAPESSGAVQV